MGGAGKLGNTGNFLGFPGLRRYGVADRGTSSMMQLRTRPMMIAILFGATTLAHAQAPAGATGQCKDGTYSNATSKSGACRGHQGVQTWYAASAVAGSAGKAPGSTPAAAKTTSAGQMSAATKPTSTSAPAMGSGPAPAGSTGQCKDGSYSNAASKSGACRGHSGVQSWYGGTATARGNAAATPMTSAAPNRAATPMPVPAASAAQRSTPAPTVPTQPQPGPRPAPTAAAPARSQAAPGGGNGQVWVNTETKVYHCSGDRYYGKTKQGAYMSEGDAQAKGFRADDGKTCSK